MFQAREQLGVAFRRLAMRVAGGDRVVAVSLPDVLQNRGRLAGDCKIAVMRAPFEQLQPIEVWHRHGLRDVGDENALAGTARAGPIVKFRIDLFGLDRALDRLAGPELLAVVEMRMPAAAHAGGDFGPHRAGQRLERRREADRGAALHRGGQRGTETFLCPAFEQGGFGGVQSDENDACGHALSLRYAVLLCGSTPVRPGANSLRRELAARATRWTVHPFSPGDAWRGPRRPGPFSAGEVCASSGWRAK